MFSKTRIEVLSILAHLIIACIVIVGWVILRLYNINDSTFNFLLVAVVTYFFGVVNTGMASSSAKARQNDQTPAPTDNSNTQQPITIQQFSQPQAAHPISQPTAPVKYDTPPTGTGGKPNE